jgi:voltage-gated potassium channel
MTGCRHDPGSTGARSSCTWPVFAPATCGSGRIGALTGMVPGAPATPGIPVGVPDGSGDSPPESRRERLAGVIEERLDIPMAVLAVVWVALIAYELVAPESLRNELTLLGNAIWLVFVIEFAVKLAISGHPWRFVRRRWPSLLFLLLPALRVLRIFRVLRVLRVLPAARVVGSSYRAIGTARALLGDRLGVVVVAFLVVTFAGGQLIFLLEPETAGSLGEALWWSANASISANLLFEPHTLPGRLVALFLAAFAVVVFASVAATLGAYFIESRTERAVAEDEGRPSVTRESEVSGPAESVRTASAPRQQRPDGPSQEPDRDVGEIEPVPPDPNQSILEFERAAHPERGA